METKNNTRTFQGTAKNQGADRVSINEFSDGKTLRGNEQICRPENEDLIRGFQNLFSRCRSQFSAATSDQEIQTVIRDVFPKYQGVEFL